MRLLATRKRDLDAKKIKHQEDSEKKRQAVKKGYRDKKESEKCVKPRNSII